MPHSSPWPQERGLDESVVDPLNYEEFRKVEKRSSGRQRITSLRCCIDEGANPRTENRDDPRRQAAYLPLITITGPCMMTDFSVTGFVLAAISFKVRLSAVRLAARLAGRCSWAVCKVLLIGVASGCNAAETLSAWL